MSTTCGLLSSDGRESSSHDAVTEATHACDAYLQNTPEVLVEVSQDATATLIWPWVHHPLVELLKNALASSVSSEKCPSIHLQLEECDDFISLCVTDQGAGVSDIDEAFRFAFSSAGKRWDRLEEQQSYAMVRSPLQSLGVGLPLSCMLLQLFHGNLTLSNNSGALGGCTAAIHLNKDDTLLEQRGDDEPNLVLDHRHF
jgi:pyruvate dehydrogenase kinase 2/3/4